MTDFLKLIITLGIKWETKIFYNNDEMYFIILITIILLKFRKKQTFFFLWMQHTSVVSFIYTIT